MSVFSDIGIENIKKVLIVKPSSLGDIIHVFPALVNLKKLLPDADFDFLINREFSSLLSHSPVKIRKPIIFERRKLGNIKCFFQESLRLIKALKQEKYDLVIDFQGLFRSGFFSFAASAKYGVCSFSEPREKSAKIFYSHRMQCTEIHAVYRNVELVNHLAGTNLRVPECDIPVFQNEPADIALPDKYIVMLPGARWESKKFPPKLFSEIARKLAEKKFNIVLAGGKDEINLCSKIAELAGNHPNISSCAGKTSLDGLFELVRNAQAVICNDSGPLHVASILNKRIFAFFGPTRPDKTGPWNTLANICANDIGCSGCLKRVCPLKSTPCHDIDVEKIVNDIANLEII